MKRFSAIMMALLCAILPGFALADDSQPVGNLGCAEKAVRCTELVEPPPAKVPTRQTNSGLSLVPPPGGDKVGQASAKAVPEAKPWHKTKAGKIGLGFIGAAAGTGIVAAVVAGVVGSIFPRAPKYVENQ